MGHVRGKTPIKGGVAKTVRLACPYCSTERDYPIDSNEARGIFVPYCPGGECEDRHAATL